MNIDQLAVLGAAGVLNRDEVLVAGELPSHEDKHHDRRYDCAHKGLWATRYEKPKPH